MASRVVATGGTRLGIRMARPKCLAVNGITALSMAPSRTCRCQSSGLRMVMRVVMSDLAAGRAVTPRSTDRRGAVRRRSPAAKHRVHHGVEILLLGFVRLNETGP